MTRVIVRAVPERGDYVAYLTQRLPDVTVVYDKVRDPFETMERALLAAGPFPAIHMEEDVVLTKNFTTKIEMAIALKPSSVIQFFSMRKADLSEGSRWDRNFLMFQCTYMPEVVSLEFLRFIPEWRDEHPEHPTAIDMAFNDFLKSRKEAYWIHVPSLVDHRVCKSAIDHRRSTKRQSLTFMEPDL